MAYCIEVSENELYFRGAFIQLKLNEKKDLLDTYGIDIVVNLWHKLDTEVRDLVWKYHHNYFPDSNKEENLNKLWLLEYAKELADYIDDGHRVLIHCYGGNNRSGLLSALVYRELYEVTGKEALQHVQALKRKALHNVVYANFLSSLGKL